MEIKKEKRIKMGPPPALSGGCDETNISRPIERWKWKDIFFWSRADIIQTRTPHAHFLSAGHLFEPKKKERKWANGRKRGKSPSSAHFWRAALNQTLSLSLCERGEKKKWLPPKNPRKSNNMRHQNEEKLDLSKKKSQKKGPAATTKATSRRDRSLDLFFIVLRKKKLKMKWGGQRGWLLGTL